MSAKIGVALLIGGASAAALADKLPPSKRALALYGGLGAAAGGLFLLAKAAKDAGGIFSSLGSLIANNDKAVLESVEVVEPPKPIKFTGGGNVPATPQQAAEAGRPGQFVIPYLVEVLSPLDGATVNPSLWNNDYAVQLRITNATNETIRDVVSYEITEDYALGGDEISSGVSEPITVLPKQSVLAKLKPTVAGGRVRYSTAFARGVFTFRGFKVSASYTIKP